MNSCIVFGQEALFSVKMTLVNISFNFFALLFHVSLSCTLILTAFLTTEL